MTPNSHGNLVPKPLGMRNNQTGGGKCGAQGAVIDHSATGQMAVGLNNVGLLVRLYGKVTARSGMDWNGYFYIDDGSGLDDGSGHIGLKCRVSGSEIDPGALPSVGSFAVVTGVMGVKTIDGVNARYLWTTSVKEIVK